MAYRQMQYAMIWCIYSRLSTVKEVYNVSRKKKKAASVLEEGKYRHDPHGPAGQGSH